MTIKEGMRFSLIVPVAPGRNAEILEAIKHLDYPKDQFHVVVAVGTNASYNRNRGIMRSMGEYVVFLDDDAIIESDYLRKIDLFLERHPDIDIVGGPQLTPPDDGFFAKISGYALASFFGAWKLANRYEGKYEKLDVDETALTSANLICKKKVVEKVKFDETLFPGEDPKFISDAKKAGFRVAYTPTFILYHKRRATFPAFVKQMYNYGKARPKKEGFFQTLKMPFFFIPSLFVLYLLALIGSALFYPSITASVTDFGTRGISQGFLWFLPLIAYIVLMLVFGLIDAVKNNHVRAFFVLPFIYPVIHISYGLGMIAGYVKKVL
ncbi:MAG: glycosyltransferase family 2 protein [Nanoarchaeota archaeon]